MNITKSTKASDIVRKWHIIDVKNKVLGKVAVEVASYLIGKSKPYFVSHLDCGDYVVVINCKEVTVTGKKATQKVYSRYSGYPGGLRKETFEELRMLLNYQQNDRFLLTLILIGQSELRKRLKELPQLKQRLIIDYHLEPLDEQDTQRYLEHRLKIAGAQKSLFDANAKKLVYRYSGGIPRVINGICDMALLEGYLHQKPIVDETIVKKVVKDANIDQLIWASS